MLDRIRRRWREILVVVVLVVVLAGAGVVAYYGTPLPVDRDAAQSVRDDPDVRVDQAYGGYVLRPDDPPTDGERTALVFYPGGRVAPESYLYTLAPLVERTGITVFVPGMPLNLAVLNGDAAGGVIDDNPEVDRWYVGGHSLGGVFACRFARSNPDRVEGVVVFASYCDQSIADADLRALAVLGTRDAVLDRQAFEDNRDNLPDDARVARIEGMNHSQFGAYSGQPGGAPATIDRATARDRLTEVLVEWIAGLERDRTVVRR